MYQSYCTLKTVPLQRLAMVVIMANAGLSPNRPLGSGWMERSSCTLNCCPRDLCNAEKDPTPGKSCHTRDIETTESVDLSVNKLAKSIILLKFIAKG